MFPHVLGIILILLVLTVAYFLLRYPQRGLAGILSVHELGKLEASLPGLREVIVVCDHVEDPQDQLRQAVKANFRRGVRYRFLVSDEKAERELDRYITIFRDLARIEGRRPESSEADDLVVIEGLPYPWVEVPYIFYKVGSGQAAGDHRYIAVRGNQRKEGIADFYSYVEPAYAHMVARSILSDAPSRIIVEREEVAQSNVVDFDPTYKRHSS